MQLEELIETLPEELAEEIAAVSDRERDAILILADKNPDYFNGKLISSRSERFLATTTQHLEQPRRERVEEFYDRTHLLRAAPQIARAYIRHYRKKRQDSVSFVGFFHRFNAKTGRINQRSSDLQKYFDIYKMYGEEEGLTFAEFFEQYLDTRLAKRLSGVLIERREGAPREFSIEQGLQAYVRHYERFRERSATLANFFISYNPVTLESGRGTCLLKRHYNAWDLEYRQTQPDFGLYLLNKVSGELRDQLETIRTTLSERSLDPRTVAQLEKAAQEFLLR